MTVTVRPTIRDYYSSFLPYVLVALCLTAAVIVGFTFYRRSKLREVRVRPEPEPQTEEELLVLPSRKSTIVRPCSAPNDTTRKAHYQSDVKLSNEDAEEYSREMLPLPLRLARQTFHIQTSNMVTEGSQETVDLLTKRKELRKTKSAIYKKNRRDPAMERAAREGTLLIPLETVRKEWLARSEFSTTTKLARHYDIFEHMFNGEEFKITVGMSVAFGETDHVLNGNFLTPYQASSKPTVNYSCSEDSHWTLVFTNPDGNMINKDAEFLHWMIGNIPGSRIADGEVLSEYLPPVPVQGTGFHRYVFCLLKQSGKLDLGKHVCRNGRDITSRTFSLSQFLSDHKEDLTPAGLCFFQATWDENVTQTFMEMLGMTEPVYKAKEFLTPEQIEKNLTRDLAERKYRNM
ncbi:39S ribosomal protein L38, mitochondrial [Desmophyllum pertusum]|uniref:Large ribosomal subunit protein mL38 n=1 Tax=Desmophyllum pertusum TaxID=174260 RepID=A0A9W9YI02_9CNID|nr:39S ribosomal protein L38, mitochondrial [Desmophyllum pertusum]